MRRIEQDALGSLDLPEDCPHGIHTARALANFDLAGRTVAPALVRAYGAVKLACARAARRTGLWRDDTAKADAIEQACIELADGRLQDLVRVDALQGGAGTSLNMNVNEVLANRALGLLGLPPGRYARVSPHDDLNAFQSTNDTFPTALRLATLCEMRGLEESLVALQEAFQTKEREFAHVVKVARTQLQDAVLTTLGRSMSAYAEAVGRDRWRLYKCEERLRVVPLGGTAIGTGLGAPRDYIFRATEELRALTGFGFCRAENLVEATQNADVWVECSGLLKTCATTLFKICTDLRLLAGGPDAGLAELVLPARQEGSSMMPAKINPVIPEAVSQAAITVVGHDAAITWAAASGNLELNPFLPLIADALLDAVGLLRRACVALRTRCIDGLQANEAHCRAQVHGATALATALLPALGHARTAALAAEARQLGVSVRSLCLEKGWLDAAALEALLAPEAVCRLGSPPGPADTEAAAPCPSAGPSPGASTPTPTAQAST